MSNFNMKPFLLQFLTLCLFAWCIEAEEDYIDLERIHVRATERRRYRSRRKRDVTHLDCIDNINVRMSLPPGKFVENHAIIVDHIFDAESGQKAYLLNPYLIIVKQYPSKLTFGLREIGEVNGEIKEEVINKEYQQGFRGCDDYSPNPTCGISFRKGIYVPYSQGFCCSCDEKINKVRQYGSHMEDYGRKIQKRQVVEVPLPKQRYRFQEREEIPYDVPSNERQPTTNQPSVLANRNFVKMKVPPNYDPFQPKVYQIRGGQDCMDTYTPPYCDPTAYHDSAHCLRFSDLWYSVCDISSPKIDKNLLLKVYEKRETGKGPVWVDLLNKKLVKLGSEKNRYLGKHMKVELGLPKIKHYVLDPDTVNLLLPKDKKRGISNPEEILVVDKRMVDLSGKSCDKIGVSYEGFFNQDNRCDRPQGTCLKNQPLQLLRHDRDLETKGQKGRYLLKNFAEVPRDAFPSKSGGGEHSLQLSLEALDTLKLTLHSTGNALFNGRLCATITEVALDTMNPKYADIYIKIHNSGLMTNHFKVMLSNCSWELPAKWNIETQLTSIPAQCQVTFKVRIPCFIPSGVYYCTVSAVNIRNNVVAQRRIRIINEDICICSFYCNCACLNSPNGLECRLLTRQQYNLAGFRGLLPLRKSVIRITIDEAMALGFFTFFILLVIILFLLGLAKAIIGCCFCHPTGLFGLKVLLGLPRPLCRYYERSLRNCEVVYDCKGWPIHPVTKKRTVRPISCILEFCINIVFFFIYPPMMLCVLAREIISGKPVKKRCKVERVDNIVITEDCYPCLPEDSDPECSNTCSSK